MVLLYTAAWLAGLFTALISPGLVARSVRPIKLLLLEGSYDGVLSWLLWAWGCYWWDFGCVGHCEPALAHVLQLLSRRGTRVSVGARAHQLLSACHRQLYVNIHTIKRGPEWCLATHAAPPSNSNPLPTVPKRKKNHLKGIEAVGSNLEGGEKHAFHVFEWTSRQLPSLYFTLLFTLRPFVLGLQACVSASAEAPLWSVPFSWCQ